MAETVSPKHGTLTTEVTIATDPVSDERAVTNKYIEMAPAAKTDRQTIGIEQEPKRRLLPIRSRVLHLLSTVESLSVTEAVEALKKEYGKERQFTWSNLRSHLMNLKENDLIVETGYSLVDGRLDMSFAINDEGRKIVSKYLPRAWRV